MRSSELQLRLRPLALDHLERQVRAARAAAAAAAAPAPARAAKAAVRGGSADDNDDSLVFLGALPDWRPPARGDGGGGDSEPLRPWALGHGPGAQGVSILTASNMHRAELLEAVTAWVEDATGENLPIDQVHFAGSPPSARGQWRPAPPTATPAAAAPAAAPVSPSSLEGGGDASFDPLGALAAADASVPAFPERIKGSISRSRSSSPGSSSSSEHDGGTAEPFTAEEEEEEEAAPVRSTPTKRSSMFRMFMGR